jgi:hypothetical protein
MSLDPAIRQQQWQLFRRRCRQSASPYSKKSAAWKTSHAALASNLAQQAGNASAYRRFVAPASKTVRFAKAPIEGQMIAAPPPLKDWINSDDSLGTTPA